MKTVTANFEIAQNKPDATPVRVVEYKRRIWNATTRSFDWESSWTELPVNRVSNVSEVNWQLDTDQLNEFKVSNVSLVLRNDDGYFNLDNPTGFFGQDDASPFFVYEAYWTKFRVRAGYLLADGTEEVVTVFTGLVAPDPVYESETKTVQFPLQGLEAILLNTKAEDVATAVTDEDKGLGNGVTTAFTTTNPGVGGVTQVTLNGVVKVEGSDYSVSQLNESALGAKVTFTVAPTGAQRVRISYFYWPQGYQFHELVEALLDAAGIDPANQDVQSVVFENSVLNEQQITSQVDWDAGTKTRIDTARSAGDMYIDWTDTALKQSTTWTTSTSGWTRIGDNIYTSDGTYIIATSTGFSSAFFHRAQTNITGMWEFKYTFSAKGNNVNLFYSASFYFMCTMSGSGISEGWGISISNDATLATIGLSRKLTSDGGTIGGNIQSYNYPSDTSEHTVKVVYYKGGNFKVYLDGTLRITANDNTINVENLTQASLHTSFSGAGTSGETIKFRQISIPVDTITASWESTTIDLNAAPSAWGAYAVIDTKDGATVTYETKTSTDGISFDSYVAVVGTAPQSAFKRYLKTKVSISFASSDERDPVISDIIIRWTTSGVPVVLPAAFTGKNIYEAMQILGGFTNYEFGFGPDEVFFFRPKTAGASVFDVDQSTFGAKIYGKEAGYGRMYGTVRVTYGSLTKEVTDDASNPESPKARVLDNRYDFTADDGIQVAATADIATGVARGLFTYFSKRRARFKLSTKFLPQIDLSDVVTVTHISTTPNKLWWLGDPGVDLGDKSIFLWGEKEQLAFNTEAKVIAARYDVQNFKCEFELEEVVS